MNRFDEIREDLLRVGVVLTKQPGEYELSVKGSSVIAFRTEDLADASVYGHVMAESITKVPVDPPIGPVGSTGRGKQRALIYRHNRKLLARRLKRAKAK